jgi:hypothetical protein
MTADTIELRNLDRGVLIDVDHGQEPQNKESEPQMPPAAAAAAADAAAAAAEYSSLPPVDTGREAWLFLTACWFVEAFTFGESAKLPLLFADKTTCVVVILRGDL